MTYGGFTSQQQLARKIRAPQSVISDLLSGKAKHSRYVTDIAVACKVSPNWLHTGKGERKIGELEQTFYSLHQTNQEAVMDMMRALKARQGG